MGEFSLSGYRKLIVYRRLIELVKLVYQLVKRLPDEEKFGLRSQMCRASVSVLSNFVEGYYKKSPKEKLQFIERAVSSLHELGAQGDVCLELKFWQEPSYKEFLSKVQECGYLIDRYQSKIPHN